MDEREVKDLLQGAASSVQPNADLAERAEQRYHRRRVRGRVLAAAVVIALVGSGVAVAATIGDGSGQPNVVAPSTSVRPTTPTTTRSTGTPANPSRIGAVSFVDANLGFGLSGSGGEPLMPDLVRTDDGGRTWRRVGSVPNPPTSLHFENANVGIAYGNGPLEVTTDGGASWSSPPDGPFHADVVSWSSGRLWSLVPCVQSCGAKAVEVSDDGGQTWKTVSPPVQGGPYASIVAVSASTAYVVGGYEQLGHPRLAVTNNGGSSWQYESTPCGLGNPYLTDNGNRLLLICAQGRIATQEFDVYTSEDEGQTWKLLATDPFVGGYFGSLTNVGSTFIAGMERGDVWSSSDGVSWSRGTNVGEGFWSIFPLPGVGAWAINDGSVDDPHSGIWFSADGVHWEQRAGATTTTMTAPVGLTDIDALSFVDAHVGFGLVADGHIVTSDAVRTDDGGYTWRRIGTLVEIENFVHFENASDGVAWGQGPLEFTTDGGAHWATTSGPVDNTLAWSDGRLWGMTPQLAITTDGGATWTYRPAPCATWTQSAPLAATDNLLGSFAPANRARAAR